MYNGKIKETGFTKEIFENPKDDYTKHLLSSEPKKRSYYDKKGIFQEIILMLHLMIKVSGKIKFIN